MLLSFLFSCLERFLIFLANLVGRFTYAAKIYVKFRVYFDFDFIQTYETYLYYGPGKIIENESKTS